MNKRQVAITLGIMCFILTLAISIQFKTVGDSNNTVSQSLKENGLRDEVLKWKERYDNAYAQLTESTKQLETIRKDATKDDTSANSKQEEITQNNMWIGTTKVQGPGVEITLTDNNTGLTSEGAEVLEFSSQVVHAEDLIEVINALNNAGAEAISINDQRIIQTSAITCEGNVIKINGQRVTSPFKIKAIGSQGLLYGINMIGGYLYWMGQEGVLVDIKQLDLVTIEKYNGVINYKYVNDQK